MCGVLSMLLSYVTYCFHAGAASTVSMPLYVDDLSSRSPDSDPYFVATLVSALFAILFGGILAGAMMFTDKLNASNTDFSHLQMALVGVCSGCSGTLSMFATPTTRTSGFLQAIIGSFAIPLTVRWALCPVPARLLSTVDTVAARRLRFAGCCCGVL